MPNSDVQSRETPPPSAFEWAVPPPEWCEERFKQDLVIVATTACSVPAEPTKQQREHAAMAAVILNLGARIEALEKQLAEVNHDA